MIALCETGSVSPQLVAAAKAARFDTCCDAA
jgi:hypothetical protein